MYGMNKILNSRYDDDTTICEASVQYWIFTIGLFVDISTYGSKMQILKWRKRGH